MMHFKKYRTHAFLSLIVAALATAGCQEREQVDITPPEIKEVSIDGTIVTGIQVEQGSEINLSVHVTDNKELEKISITLVTDDDAPTPPTGVFSYTETAMTSLEHATVNFNLSIPDSIAGAQILRIQAVDANGYTDALSLPFVITNSMAPTISGSSNPAIDNNNEIHIDAGQNLLISGEANDADGLANLKVMLWDSNDQTIATTTIPITNTPMAFSDASFDQAVTGRYRVVIEATDNAGNRSYWGRFVIVD